MSFELDAMGWEGKRDIDLPGSGRGSSSSKGGLSGPGEGGRLDGGGGLDADGGGALLDGLRR